MKPYLSVAACMGAAALSACAASHSGYSASGSLPSADAAMPPLKSHHTAHEVCPQAPQGYARCLALIESEAAANPLVAGWGPANFQARYNLPSATKGSGQIVAIVDAYDNPNVASDLAAYRSEFGLGTGTLYKYNQKGEQGHYPAANKGWGIEIDADVEMVSATCPLCTIYLVEANSPAGSDLSATEAEAVKLGAHIVTNSWACSQSSNCVDAHDFSRHGVVYLASNGDAGSKQFVFPAALASVAAIGGTLLTQNGSQYSESVWSSSGGGCDTNEKKPSWQHDSVCSGRAVGDASAVAWDVAEYDSYGYPGWFTVGGTSVSAPLLAGVFGLAGNATKQEGGRTFWQRSHRRDLYDVCGSACLFSTYSYEGGWGSPNGIGAF